MKKFIRTIAHAILFLGISSRGAWSQAPAPLANWEMIHPAMGAEEECSLRGLGSWGDGVSADREGIRRIAQIKRIRRIRYSS